MDELTSTTGVVALAAAGVAVVALLLAIFLAARLRRLRRAQTAVLGDGNEQRDLVAHAQRLETGFTDLREWVEETMERIGTRMDGTEQRLQGCVAHSAVVRYDAYNELSGHQSSSIALLDSNRTGVVLSSIVHRDQARLYVKAMHAGEAEIALSPEEQEAVDSALGTPAAR